MKKFDVKAKSGAKRFSIKLNKVNSSINILDRTVSVLAIMFRGIIFFHSALINNIFSGEVCRGQLSYLHSLT